MSKNTYCPVDPLAGKGLPIFDQKAVKNYLRRFLLALASDEGIDDAVSLLRSQLSAEKGWTFTWERQGGEYVAVLIRRSGSAATGDYQASSRSFELILNGIDPGNEEELDKATQALADAHLRGCLVDLLYENLELEKTNQYLQGIVDFCSAEGQAATTARKAA